MIETREICKSCSGSGVLTELGRRPLTPRTCIACNGAGSVAAWVPAESVRLFEPAPPVMPGQTGLPLDADWPEPLNGPVDTPACISD